MMRLVFFKMWLLALVMPGLLWASDSQSKAPDDANEPPTVKIKQELEQIEKVYRHRLLLNYLHEDKGKLEAVLKELAPDSASAVKRTLEKDKNFEQLDYHFEEKIKNCEHRILSQLRNKDFQGVADLLEFLQDKKHPLTTAYAPLLAIVEINLRYARQEHIIPSDDYIKDLHTRLTETMQRIQGTAGYDIKETAKALWGDKKTDDLPAWWFDAASTHVSFTFEKVPATPDFPLIDLNQTDVNDLTALPGLDRDVAQAIVDYARKQNFQGPEELRVIKEIPRHRLVPLQSLCKTGHTAKKKPWTVMVFLNAANNLEPMGLEDLNEMEKVGSSHQVNVVVEMARYYTQREKPEVNSSYFYNPLRERHPVFYYGHDNEPGISRYYVLKDDDMMRVGSVKKFKGPQADAGSPQALANFGRWAVENYPAQHYALVIWDHGSGWAGVSYDDNTHHSMDLPEVRTALEEICATLDPNQHIDVLDFDACLMATLEVGYELRDTVDFLVASQAVEPGDGMPYDDYLEWLVTYPSATPAAFAKAMVKSYVHSYSPKGSQIEGDNSDFSETKSALRLSRMADLRDAVNQLGSLLLKRPELLGDVTERLMLDVRRFHGRLVDIQDLATHLEKHDPNDQAIKQAAKVITDLINYPQDKYKLVNEVVIKRRSAGSVIWGFNDWLAPPRNLAPYVHEGKLAKTPLVGPDKHGDYVARLRFAPRLPNPKTKEKVQVTEINYRFSDDSTKRSTKDFQNIFFTADFPEDNLVIAEGHMVSNNRCHGVSVYLPSYLGYNPNYQALQFAQDSPWAELCARFPLKTWETPQEIALLGVEHLTRSERERLGKLDTPQAFRQEAQTLDTAAPWRKTLEALKREFTVFSDPRPLGMDWQELLVKADPNLVIVDNTSGTPSGFSDPYGYLSSSRPTLPTRSGPTPRTLSRYLGTGGHLLLTQPQIDTRLWDRHFYQAVLGLHYQQQWDQSYDVQLVDQNEPDFTLKTARKGESICIFQGDEGVTPLVKIKDTQHMVGAKIGRTHPVTGTPFRAVVLGFYLADVTDEKQRQALMETILSFLTPTTTDTISEEPASVDPNEG